MNPFRSLSSGALVALLLAASTPDASAAAGDYDRRDDLTEAVVACEEAQARLENCCPGYSAYVGSDDRRSPCLDLAWRHTSEGCNGQTSVDTGSVKPLALAESHCILDASCDELVGRGVCERAQEKKTMTADASTRSLCR